MEVNGDANLAAQRADEFIGGVGLAKAGHVLDGKKMRTQFLELLGHPDEILQRILWAVFVENVAGVTDGRFANGTGFEHSIDGYAHIFNGVEGIEDAEDVDALRGGFMNEFHNYIVGI